MESRPNFSKGMNEELSMYDSKMGGFIELSRRRWDVQWMVSI